MTSPTLLDALMMSFSLKKKKEKKPTGAKKANLRCAKTRISKYRKKFRTKNLCAKYTDDMHHKSIL